jgi:hypothetical protein
MENLGALSILLAFCLSIFAVFAALVGKYGRRPFLIVSAERAVYSVWVLLTLASGFLVYSLMTGDYRLAYVAAHSNKAMPTLYKFTAWWGGQEGSLLLWSWLLSTYSALAVATNRRKFRAMMPIVIAILMTTEAFFTSLITFVVSPFQVLMAGKGIIGVPDGRGLDPLLQWWTMAIHPPMLYLGYVGSIVPFAFAMASLVTRQPGEGWINTTRRWAIVTWLFQTTGITLGMGWAYTVLSWGGYWGWDPVENASVMPWITATAFLHSVMMQEKKGMMKVWNMVLVSATFLLSILGTTLTRTGLVQSVHAFAQSPIKPYFTTFLLGTLALVIYAIVRNLPFLKSEAKLESVVSRESSFLFNNLILLASCFAILWGTLFPVGGMVKSDVRALARDLELPVATKNDSQEICFVPNGDYAAFIDAYFREQGIAPDHAAGDIVATDGTVLGRHGGTHHFTVGQRRGLRVAAGEPLYVIQTDPVSQRVIVGKNDALLRATLAARDVNWVSIAPIIEPRRAEVKIRNKHVAAAATLVPGGSEGHVEVNFDEPQRAVTPGQAAVFYDGELVLGGGWIE